MRTWMMVIGLVVGLAGCATQKKQLSAENHLIYAQHFKILEMCAKQGYIDTQTAGVGFSIAKDNLNTWSYNWEWISLQANNYKISPTKDDCNKMTVNIQAELYKREQYRNTAPVSPTWGQSSPEAQNMYCNRIGSQTLCRTY